MNSVIVGEGEQNKINDLMAYAEENKLSFEHLKAISNQQKPPIGEDKNYVIQIPHGYKVVFSIEEQPIGLCRHISISQTLKNEYPHPDAVNEFLRLFGFTIKVNQTHSIKKSGVYTEPEYKAINVVEVMES